MSDKNHKEISNIKKMMSKLQEKIKNGTITKDEIENQKKIIAKHLLRIARYEIPVQNIPRGVELCLKNVERLKKDAEVLAEKLSYQSAIVLMITAIEEFGKLLWLTKHFEQSNPIGHEEGKDYFNKHDNKIKEFFEYLKSIDGYKIATRTNQFVNMIDEIDDDQLYKLRMLYVNYSLPVDKSKYWTNEDGWFDPTYIWQLSSMDDEGIMHSLDIKFQELKNDLDAGLRSFLESNPYKNITNAFPPPPLEPNVVGSFLRKHFPIKGVQLSIGTGKSLIEIVLSPKKSQTSVNQISMDEIRTKLQNHFKIKNVSVRIEPKE